MDFTALKKRIMDTAESAGKKAGDMVELTKMKMQVSQYKSELSKAHEKLGAMVYNMMKEDEEDTSAISVCIDEIDYILDKIQEAEEKVKELRKVTCCQSCGGEISSDVCFCPKCGAKIERPEPPVESVSEDVEVSVEENAEKAEQECEKAVEQVEAAEQECEKAAEQIEQAEEEFEKAAEQAEDTEKKEEQL